MINAEQDHELANAQGEGQPMPGTPSGGARAPRKMGIGQRLVVVVLLTVVTVPPLAGFYSYFSGVPLHLLAGKKEEKQDPISSNVNLVEDRPHTLDVSDELAASLGIRKQKQGPDSVAVAQQPTQMRPLVLPGSTAIIPGRLARIKPRFAAARVMEIGTILDQSPTTGFTEQRELRPGDHVSKGQVLGIFYSVDVGSKKNDLLQALVQLELDQKILDEAEKHADAIPAVFLISTIRAVQGDRTEVNRALNNLKVWDIPQDEIDALRTEARNMAADKSAWSKTPEGRWFLKAKQAMERKEAIEKVDPGKEPRRGNGKVDAGNDKEEENPWGRVTLRAPFDGILIEQNVHKGEMLSDPTVNLFQVADVNQLLVIANCPEDDLPRLEALRGLDKRWTVRTVGADPATGLSGPIAEIGYLIDPNQHTAVIKGYVENPGKLIRAGQYVSASVNIPPPKDVVVIPMDALDEDGRQSLIFVQPDPAKHEFTMRRVQVTHRFADTVFVRSAPIPKEEQLTPREAEEGLLPQEPLRPGERVLVGGAVVELKRVVIDLESRPKDNGKTIDLVAKAKTRSSLNLMSRPEQKPKTGKG